MMSCNVWKLTDAEMDQQTSNTTYQLISCTDNVNIDSFVINPLMGTLEPHSNKPLYSNTVIGTQANDGWAVTFGTAKRSLGGLRPRPVPILL